MIFATRFFAASDSVTFVGAGLGVAVGSDGVTVGSGVAVGFDGVTVGSGVAVGSDGVTVGSGVGVSGSGVGVSGSGVGVSGSGAGVSGSGAGVFGSGAGVSLPSEITSPLPSPKSLAVSICSSAAMTDIGLDKTIADKIVTHKLLVRYLFFILVKLLPSVKNISLFPL